MTETLSISEFTPLVGAAFTIRFPDGTLELTLDAVEPHGTRAPRPDVPALRTAPFSLVFLGPLAPVLPQQTWDLSHPALGTRSIFLVPIGPKDGGMRYEAVFN
ncbi:MAG TPA: hypothetical protein PKA62_06830 [Thermoanaerobaculia bacterium]|nr:hypothetical protein [Thermoanaerobaculia bacterium]